jgi:hypothetical protein
MDHYFRAMRTGGLTEQQNEVFRPFFEALQSDSLSESILMDELRKLRSIDNSIHASPILETQMYRRKIGVDAIIDTKDIARFTTSLESFVSHSLGHAIDLKSVSRQNTEPHEFFSRFSSEQVSLIKHCVAESYPDELNVVNAVRCLYPSILNHSTWNSFLKSLFSGIPSIRFG